LESRV
jgi:hypothetical protein